MTGTQNPGTATLASRKARVERDLAALRKELATERKDTTKAQTETKPSEPAIVNVDPYRPKDMAKLVGQHQLVRQLKVVIHGARIRGTRMPNILLDGPSGGGKTTIASIMADELELPLVATTGMVLRKPEDLVALLVRQTSPALLFIDEVHAARRSALESIYTMLESGTLDLLGGGEASQHDVSHWVTVAASTHPGLLPTPFRSRFLSLSLDPYSTDELAEIARGVWQQRGMAYVDSEATELASRARGTPRVAVSYAERVLDFVSVRGDDKIAEGDVHDALSVFGISQDGLTAQDMTMLRVLTKEYAGKPVGITALALHVGVEESTLTDTIEPYLVNRGLILRTQRGRLATRAAYELMEQAS